MYKFLLKHIKKKETKDKAVQTDHKNNNDYRYIFDIKDKRKRRSTAWKIYKDLCTHHNIEPELVYPAGEDRDYVRLAKHLNSQYE